DHRKAVLGAGCVDGTDADGAAVTSGARWTALEQLSSCADSRRARRSESPAGRLKIRSVASAAARAIGALLHHSGQLRTAAGQLRDLAKAQQRQGFRTGWTAWTAVFLFWREKREEKGVGRVERCAQW